MYGAYRDLALDFAVTCICLRSPYLHLMSRLRNQMHEAADPVLFGSGTRARVFDFAVDVGAIACAVLTSL